MKVVKVPTYRETTKTVILKVCRDVWWVVGREKEERLTSSSKIAQP